MTRIYRATIGGLFASAFAFSACSHEDGPDQSTGLQLRASGQVEGFHFSVVRVDCVAYPLNGAPTAVEADALVSSAQTLPGGLQTFDGNPLSGDSAHPFADKFFALQPGCYDVTATPYGNRAASCSSPVLRGVIVNSGLTTERLMISQCVGIDKGALDAIVALNHDPELVDVRFPESKFGCAAPIEICVTPKDVDGDPTAVELTFPVDASCRVTPFSAVGQEQCAAITCDEPGSYAPTITVYDLVVDSLGNAIKIEDILAQFGNAEPDSAQAGSHAQLVAQVHVSGLSGYVDEDDDGFGGVQVFTCVDPGNLVDVGGDCGDRNAAIFPGADEICDDGVDNNCSGQVDEDCEHPPLPIYGFLSGALANGNGHIYDGPAVDGAVPNDGAEPEVELQPGQVEPFSAVPGGSLVIGLQTNEPVRSLDVGVAGVFGHFALLETSPAPRPQGRDESNEFATYGNGLYSVRRDFGNHERQSPQPESAAYEYSLVLTIPPDFAGDSLPVEVSAIYDDEGGSAGYAERRSRVRNLAVALDTGATSSSSMQINLSWTLDVDLDLHVATPGGSYIYYGNLSGQGGTLDLDSNPACRIDSIRSENVTWGTGVVPEGVFRIHPDYYEACEPFTGNQIDYVLTINNTGAQRAFLNYFVAGDVENDPANDLVTAVLPNETTDAGVMARMLIAEPRSPGLAGYSFQDTAKALAALKNLVHNRLNYHPEDFGARGATTTTQIIFAPGQFEGFGGGVSTAIKRRVAERTLPYQQSASMRTTFSDYWREVLRVTNGAAGTVIVDPFVGINAVGNVLLYPGTFGVRTEGSADPGGRFVAFPNGAAGGQQFYGVTPR